MPVRLRKSTKSTTVPALQQNAARLENCVQTLAQTVAAQTTEIANIEQIVASLVASLETNAASCSSGSASARTWNIFGHGNGSTAAGSLGSNGSWTSDDNAPKTNVHGALSFYGSHVNIPRWDYELDQYIVGKIKQSSPQ